MVVSTRSHSTGDAAATSSPGTPQKRGLISFLDELCDKLGIALPFTRSETVLESPGKLSRSEGHEVIRYVRNLYFQDRSRLDRLIVEFHDKKRQDESGEEIISALNRALARAAEVAKNRVLRSLPGSPISPMTSQRARRFKAEERLMPPPSPTIATKHASRENVKAARAMDKMQIQGDDDFISRKLAFIPSANTSSGSDAAKTSFMTDTTNRTAQDTPFTSFDTIGDGADESKASQMSEYSMPDIPPSLEKQLIRDAAASRTPKQLEHYRVAEIASTGMVHDHLPPSLATSLPFDLRVEALRLSLIHI